MNDFNEHNYLCHYGVLGMKWGVRRYQNKDGSLTAEGKARKQWGPAEANKSKLASSSVSGGGYVSDENIKEPEDQVAFYNDTLNEIRKTHLYNEIFELTKRLTEMANNRKENLGQTNAATNLVFEQKTDTIIEQINTALKSLDDTFAKETKIIRKNNSSFSPSVFMLSELTSYPKTSAGIAINRSTGRVAKAWGDTNSYLNKDKKVFSSGIKHSTTFNEQDYLCHYGIKGMKWGIRRYENPDGSLTPLGIQRYGSKRGLKKAIKSEIKKARTIQDEVMSRQHAMDYSKKEVEKRKNIYLKTGKKKHLANYMAARESNVTQTRRFKQKQQEMKEHYNKLVKEYGKENVSKINYENGKVKEKTKDVQRMIGTYSGLLIGNLASLGISYATNPGFVMIGYATPDSAESIGKRTAKNDYKTYRKIERKVAKQTGNDLGEKEGRVDYRRRNINKVNKLYR